MLGDFMLSNTSSQCNQLVNFFQFKLDPEDFSNDQFARSVAARIPSDALVLDAGAGKAPYAHYHREHRYMTIDYGGDRTVKEAVLPDCFSDVANIPFQENVFDAILCYQVLEHVSDPQQVLQGLYSVLRPGGRLYLTVPQGWGLHHEPHHYFNFTRYGLRLLFDRVGFVDVNIEERGGIFWLLAQRLQDMPYYILFQYLYPLIKPSRAASIGLDTSRFANISRLVLLLPLYICSLPFFKFFIPLIFFLADKLDKRRLTCLGYQCMCCKPEREI